MSGGKGIVVAGGGASGMMAAITAAERGARVTLVEPNEKVGRKLYITGKGRCNLTNACDRAAFMEHVVRNGKFLYSAVSRFSPWDTMAFFEELGVPLKVERGNRVFPVSDRAADVVDGLFYRLKGLGVTLLHDRVTGLVCDEGAIQGVRLAGREDALPCQTVVLATGGASYPRTGSTGDGYRLARQAGHTVTKIRGSLAPLESPDGCCPRLQGLSLRNVKLWVTDCQGGRVYTEQGELLFTHFGLSGPLVLSASAHMDFDRERYTAHIDLKPALDGETLDGRLLREFGARANQDISNVLGGLLPRTLIPIVIERGGIPGDTKARDIRREQRQVLLGLLKDFAIPVSGPRPVAEAIVTAGGVEVAQIHPKTMESKLVKGLFFAGELLDVDGYTGGFNLQIAWSTGRAAGLAAAEFS